MMMVSLLLTLVQSYLPKVTTFTISIFCSTSSYL